MVTLASLGTRGRGDRALGVVQKEVEIMAWMWQGRKDNESDL